MSLEEPEETLDESSLSGAQKQRNKKRRRFRRRWILASVLLFLIAAFLFLLGPGFRMIAPAIAIKAAATQGLTGYLEIDGNLWSGISVRNATFTQLEPKSLPANPDQPIVVSAELGELSISYRAWGIISGAADLNWIDLVKLDSLDLVLLLPEAPVEKEKKEKEPKEKKPRTEFHPAWNLLDTEIRIDQVSATIQQGETRYSISGFGLESLPGPDGQINVESISLPEQEPIDGITVPFQKGEHSLKLGPVPINPVGELRSITVAEPSPTVFTFGLEALVAGGELAVAFTSEQNLRVSLREDTAIDLALLFPEKKEELPLTGVINTLTLDFLQPLAKPSQWKLGGQIEGSNLGWDEYGIDRTSLRLEGNRLNLDLKRPDASVQVFASMPLSNAESIEELQELPIDLGAAVSVPELATLLGNLGQEIPLEGSLELEAKNFQADTKGNLNTGTLLLQSEQLAFDGLGIPTLQVAAMVEQPNRVKLAANAAVDSKTALRMTGSFDKTSMSYEGEAQANFESGGSVTRWMATRKELALAGAGSFQWTGSGTLEDSVHKGEATVSANDLRVGDMKPVFADLALDYEADAFRLSRLQLGAGSLALSGTGGWDGKVIELRDWVLQDNATGAPREVLSFAAGIPFDPSVEGEFLDQPGALAIDLAVRELELGSVLELLSSEPPPLTGPLSGQLTATGKFREIASTGNFVFAPHLESVGDDSQVELNLDFAGSIPAPQTWDATVDAEVSGLQWKEVELGLVDLHLQTDNSPSGNPLVGDLRFEHAGTEFQSDFRMDLTNAETLEALGSIPIDFSALLSVESIGALLRDFAPPNVAGFPADGSLNAELKNFRLQNKSLTSGEATIGSDTLAISDQQFETIAIDARVEQPDQLAATLQIALDEKSRVEGGGGYHLKDQSYSGELALEADLKGEGKLRNLLADRNIAKLLPGTTSLAWKGDGNVTETKHRGELTLAAATLSLADGSVPIDLGLSGSYSEDSADFPDFKLESEVFNLHGGLLWKDDILQLSNWSGTSSGSDVLKLDASVPLAKDSLGLTWFDQKENLSLNLDISELPIESISRLFLAKAPVNASLNFDLAAKGSPSELSFDGDLGLNAISLPSKKGDITLGRVAMKMAVANEKASLDGRYEHPDLNPLTITAGMPFFPADWARGQRKVVDESLSLTADMEKSDLAFLTGLVPVIESINGTIGINAALEGSIAKPSITGDGILEVSRLRLDNRDAPSFYDIDFSTRFADNRLTIERLYAVVAGGVVEGEGNVLLAPGTEPKFDLRVTGTEVLLFRTPDLNLRTHVDIALRGPFSAARLAGEIGITNSRFFKNFDLLPTSLPSRSTSVLPTVERGPSGGGVAYKDLDFGVKVEPFSNWTTDIRVHTRDPFLVRSNLVESDLVADIRIGGTLGRLVPVGHLSINEGEMSLPFSSVDVQTGRVEFDEKTGFNGALEFKAQAKADKYRINVFLYNRVLDPKYTLTSIPPMPSEDLISLLITGTARQDLVGGGVGGMAAGKAATLLFKNMRKASAEADKEPGLLDNLQERTELEIGGINPETGAHTVGGKIRLWKQLFFVGDVDARNDYRAVLKYVFRFR